jgi:hypothetical protein
MSENSKIMATPLATKIEPQVSMLAKFAHTQMSEKIRQSIEDSTFLELASCAFFCGAEAQIRKLSQLDERTSLDSLIDVVMDIGNVGKSKTVALINTIYRLSGKYYLLENIFEQGKTAADQWLNCQDEEKQPLLELVNKYSNLTMFDLGIEGVNEQYNEQQQALYASVEQSVSKLRRRALFFVLITASAAVAVFIYLRFWALL